MHDQWKYIDNLVISTKPIGPVEFVYEGDYDKAALKKALTVAIGPDSSKPVYQLEADDYTLKEWNANKKSVKSALAVEKNNNASQRDIDAALASLSATRDGLQTRTVNVSEKAGRYLFADDFSSGQLDAYFEKNGVIDSICEYKGSAGFMSTIRRGAYIPFRRVALKTLFGRMRQMASTHCI